MKPPRLRELLGFFAFSHGWTWFFWTVASYFDASVWEWPGVIFLYIGGAGVPLGALVMTGITYGRNGLADLGWRVIDARRIRGCWWIPIVLLFPALGLSAAVFTLVIGASTEPLDLAGALAKVSQPVNFAVFAFFILVVGPLPEEIGWRGYLLDRLQARWSAVSSSLFIGVVWWLWHMPLFALPGYFDAFRRASPAPLDFLFALLPSAILYTWIYNNTGRSVLAVVLFHFMENFTGEFLGMVESVDPYRLALAAALAVVVTVTWGPKKLRRTPRMEPPVY